MNSTGTLYLIPSVLGPDALHTIPEYVRKQLDDINIFIVENERTARRFLRAVGYKKDFDTEVTLHLLDKRTRPQEFSSFLNEVVKGKNAGILSEAGSPGIADPGGQIVAIAHKRAINVVPLIGPNAILLALMASGLNGQQFAFNGYLPIKNPGRAKAIKRLEGAVQQFGVTQIFMETPFRNHSFLDDMIKNCRPDTLLTIACDLTLESEKVVTMPMKMWKQNLPDIHKRPCVFLLGKPAQ